MNGGARRRSSSRQGSRRGEAAEGGRQADGRQTLGKFPPPTHAHIEGVCVWKSRMPSLGRGSARQKRGGGRGYCGEATLKREKNRSLFLGKKRKLKP